MIRNYFGSTPTFQMHEVDAGLIARPIPHSDVNKFIYKLLESGFRQTSWSGGGRFVKGMA